MHHLPEHLRDPRREARHDTQQGANKTYEGGHPYYPRTYTGWFIGVVAVLLVMWLM